MELVFGEVGIVITWQGEGVEEIGINNKTGDVLIEIDPRYFRPTEVDILKGGSNKGYDEPRMEG